MKPQQMFLPAQLKPLLMLHLDKVLVEGARALDDPEYMPDWSLEPCREGEMLKITIERVVPEPLTQKATVA